MNTRRSGSSSGRACSQASRRTATSGLSCSAACAVFFKRHGVAIEEAPYPAARERSAVLQLQHLDDLGQREIDLLLDRPKDNAAIDLDALGAAVTTLALCCPPARLTPRTHPAHRACRR